MKLTMITPNMIMRRCAGFGSSTATLHLLDIRQLVIPEMATNQYFESEKPGFMKR